MNNKKENIKLLVNRYFEGLTSLEEEQFLCNYFQGEEIDEEFEALKPLFRFFIEERKSTEKGSKGEKRKIEWIQWISVAACLVLIVGLGLFFNSQRNVKITSQAYIDGEKYTDIELIQSQVLNSLINLSEGEEDVFSSQIEILDSFSDFFE